MDTETELEMRKEEEMRSKGKKERIKERFGK